MISTIITCSRSSELGQGYNIWTNNKIFIKAKFDTSRYSSDKNRLLSLGKNKKVISMMNEGLAGKFMAEC